ncbi:hypothetical protein AAHE18_20G202400 [Arachis hypogaea]
MKRLHAFLPQPHSFLQLFPSANALAPPKKETLASTNLVAVCRSGKLLLPPPLHSRTSVFVLSAFATSISPTPVRSPSPVRSHESPGRRRPRAQQLFVVRRRC